MAFAGKCFNLLDRTALASLVGVDSGTRVLEHRQRMQRNVGTRPGVRRRRQVVGVGFAGDLEDGEFLRSWHFGA
ncbi:MAG: hypothetical protein AW09_002178 [Candidatus Accumulibacter phosphatis]|uniref:Uncharacterized protein n=1 Tax=Candidatus Accumulibacter phosphatis TaxID=327160 RepID=A0A080LVJ7_9PROT|nr:MAG: hypothetical protein AW09_002178 [Candidatus Accumulibacter phosphatis]